MIRSAWRGEARPASAPKRAMSYRAVTAAHRYPLDRAAGEAEGEREHRVRPRPVEHLLEVGHHDPLLDVALQLLALEVAAQHVAGAQPAALAVVWRSTSNRALPFARRRRRRPAAGRRRDQLGEDEDAVGVLEDHRDGVEEDDLDVEEDEEHRDEVEADSEAEAVRSPRPGCPTRTARPGVGVAAVGPRRALRPDHVVEHREGAPDRDAEEGKDEYRQVALQHWGLRVDADHPAGRLRSPAPTACSRFIHPPCDRLLHSDFPHQQAESRPS